MEKTCRNDIAWFSFFYSVRLSNFLSVHSTFICINRLASQTHDDEEGEKSEHESKSTSLCTLKTMINYDIEGKD